MSRGRQQPGSRKSWKRGTLVGQQPVQSKRGLRWFLTIAVLGLIGFFAWALWPDPWGERPFVHLAILRYERLKIPQIPFITETLSALREPSQVDTQLSTHDFTRLQKAEDLTNLGKDLNSLVRDYGKVLIVYAAGHGISDGGKPFLACSDYLASQGTEGKIPIRNLLRSVSDTKSDLKLLLLDAQHFGHDPRLGVVANEFNLLVADEVQALPKESNTWVLLNCGTLETGSIAYGQNLSLFGLAVKEGLSKMADVDRIDNFVTLFEFVQHIEKRCSSWFGADIDVTQTPGLLRAGNTGTASLDKSEHGLRPFNLAFVKPKNTSADQKDSPPAADPEKKAEPKGDSEKEKSKVSRGSTSRRAGQDSADNVGRTPGAGEVVWNSLRQRFAPRLAVFQQDSAGSSANKTTPNGTGDASKSTPPTNKDAAAKGTTKSEATAGASPGATQSTAGTKSTDRKSDENAKSSQPPTKDANAPTATGTDGKSPDATKKSGDDSAAKSGPTTNSHVASVHQVWKLRDEVSELRALGGASVVEFAPAAWRELENTILWFERQVRSGQNPEVKEANRPFTSAQELELREIVADLTELNSAVGSGKSAKIRADDVRVGTRLLKAWNAYQEKNLIEDQTYDQTSRIELRNAKSAWLKLRQSIYRAPYFVRTVAALGLTSERGSIASQNVDNYLGELAAAQRSFASIRSGSAQIEDPSRLLAFIATVDAVTQRRQMIEEQFATEANTSLAQKTAMSACRRLDDLLSTPMLAANARRDIVTRLLEPILLPEAVTLKALPRPDGLVASTQRWRQAFQRLSLEKKLVDLFDPLSGERIKRQLGTIEQQVTNIGGSEQIKQREIWKSFQSAADTLQKSYAGIPASPKEETLLLVDPRDAQHDNLRPGRFPIPEFRLELMTPPKLELQLLADNRTELPRTGSKSVKVRLLASQKWLLDVPVIPSFLDRAISVREVESGSVESREGQFSRTITFEVSAKMDQSRLGLESTPLSFKANWSSGGQAREEAKSLAIVLPLANRIDLEIVRSGGGGSRISEGDSAKKEGAIDGSFLVPLFANRKTTYVLRLVNRSGRPQSLKGDLYRVRATTTGGQLAGRTSESTRNAVLDKSTGIVDADVIATTAAPLSLSADPNEREILKVGPPGATPAPASPQPAAGGGPAAPMPPATAAEVDVGRGLLLALSSTENKNDRWYKWIELAPLEPSAYVEPIVVYDQKLQQITITVQRRKEGTTQDGQRVPFPTDSPIPVVWETSTAALPEGNKQPEGQLDEANNAVLFAAVPPDNMDRIVHLSVDDYPRAFAFRVTCREDADRPRFIPGAPIRRTAMPIRIVSLSVPSQSREYLVPPYVVPKLPPVADTDKPRTPPIELPEGVPAVFKAPCDPILVKLQADLPIGFADAQEQIHVSLAANPDRIQKFYRDRHFAPRIKRFGEQGELEFVADVRDHTVQVVPGALQNQQTYVEARAILSGEREVTAVTQVKLDSLKPGLRVTNIPRPILKDSKPTLQFTSNDLTGVSLLEYAISPNDLAVFPKDGIKSIPVRSDPRSTRHDMQLPFDTKGMEPGRYTLLVRATDMVGNQGDIVPVILNIEIPKVAPKKNDGVISGVVKLDGQYPIIASFFAVEISGPEARMVKKLKSDGSFEETGLPYGMYTIKAKGTLSDAKEAAGEKMVEPSPPNAVKQVVVSVSRKPSPGAKD